MASERARAIRGARRRIVQAAPIPGLTVTILPGTMSRLTGRDKRTGEDRMYKRGTSAAKHERARSGGIDRGSNNRASVGTVELPSERSNFRRSGRVGAVRGQIDLRAMQGSMLRVVWSRGSRTCRRVDEFEERVEGSQSRDARGRGAVSERSPQLACFFCTGAIQWTVRYG